MDYLVLFNILCVAQLAHRTFAADMTMSEGFLDEWDMHNYCGYTVRVGAAGRVEFDFHALDYDDQRYYAECNFTIQTTREYHQTRLFLYFTTMQLDYDCKQVNLTLHDGPDTTFPVLKGTKPAMCGHNTTLDDVIFYSGNDSSEVVSLTISVKWSEDFYWASSSTNEFRFDFNTDYGLRGELCDDVDEFQRCDNNLCILEWTNCDDKLLKPCGNVTTECNPFDIEMLENMVAEIFENLKTYIWIFVVIIAIVVIVRILKTKGFNPCRKTHRECPQQELALHTLARSGSNSPQPSSILMTVDNGDSRPTEYTDTPDPSYGGDRYNSPGSDRYNDQALLPPSAPPPSYDDAMAPSYQTVMSDQDKYKATL